MLARYEHGQIVGLEPDDRVAPPAAPEEQAVARAMGRWPVDDICRRVTTLLRDLRERCAAEAGDSVMRTCVPLVVEDEPEVTAADREAAQEYYARHGLRTLDWIDELARHFARHRLRR